jgi:hypothetical protein
MSDVRREKGGQEKNIFSEIYREKYKFGKSVTG